MQAKLTSQDEYRPHLALNYSLLKQVDSSPWELIQDKKPESKAMIMGTGVDTLLTSPQEWDKKFVVFDLELPDKTTLIGKFIDIVYQAQDFSDDFLEVAYNAVGFKQKSLEAIKKEFEPIKEKLLYKKKCIDSGKYLINTEENTKINRAVFDLQTHQFTSKYFTQAKGVEILYQVPIVYEHTIEGKTVELKALLDLVYIDHTNKIIEPKDIKTTRFIDSFYQSILSYRYDIQNVIYYKAVCEYFGNLYPDYLIEKFEFLCIDFSQPGKIRKFMLNDYFNKHSKFITEHDIFEINPFNDWFTKSGRKMKGVNTLIKDYLWHIETGNYDYTKELYDNNGTTYLEL